MKDFKLTDSTAIGNAEATEGAATVLARLGGGKLRSVFNRFENVDAAVDAKQGKPLPCQLEVSMTDNIQFKR